MKLSRKKLNKLIKEELENILLDQQPTSDLNSEDEAALDPMEVLSVEDRINLIVCDLLSCCYSYYM